MLCDENGLHYGQQCLDQHMAHIVLDPWSSASDLVVQHLLLHLWNPPHMQQQVLEHQVGCTTSVGKDNLGHIPVQSLLPVIPPGCIHEHRI